MSQLALEGFQSCTLNAYYPSFAKLIMHLYVWQSQITITMITRATSFIGSQLLEVKVINPRTASVYHTPEPPCLSRVELINWARIRPMAKNMVLYTTKTAKCFEITSEVHGIEVLLHIIDVEVTIKVLRCTCKSPEIWTSIMQQKKKGFNTFTLTKKNLSSECKNILKGYKCTNILTCGV